MATREAFSKLIVNLSDSNPMGVIFMATRKITDPNFESFTPPDLIHYSPLRDKDAVLVKKISNDLSRAGVLDHTSSSDQSLSLSNDSFQEIFNQGAAGAKYENEINSDFYSPEVEKLVIKREAAQKSDWENPDLVGLDAFGEPIKSIGLSKDQITRLQSEEEEDELDAIMNNVRENKS